MSNIIMRLSLILLFSKQNPKEKGGVKMKFNIPTSIKQIAVAILMIIPVLTLAQVSPGDVITADLTLTQDLDASSYGGPGLRVGANNITIDGAGFTITVNGNNPAFELSSRTGVTIKNATVVGGTAGQGRGVNINNSSNCTIENNTFSGLYNALYVTGTNNTNTIHNNNMSGSTNNAFESHYLANSVDWVIKDNDITGGSFYALNYLGKLAELSGNDFSNSNRGVSLSNGYHTSAAPLVLTWQGSIGPNKNTFGGHTSYVLTLNNMYYVNVSGWDMPSLFTATATSKQGFILNGVRDSHFEDNDLSGLFNAVYVSGTGYRNTLINNNMSGSTNNAFESHYLANSVDWVIKDNDITGGSFYALNYLGKLAELSGNDFSNSNRGVSLSNGYHTSAAPLVLTWQGSIGPNKNTFGGHTSYVLTLNNMYYVNVSGWDMPSLFTATATSKQGFILNGVRDSHFEDNDLSGLFNAVYVSGTGYRNTLINNNMSGSTGNGFESYVHNCNNVDWVITGNNLTNTNGTALSYIGRPADISGNDFTGSNGGINFRGAHNFTLLGNSNTWDLADAATAVSIEYTNNLTIENLTITGDGGTGVYVGWNTSNVVIDSLETCGDLGVNLQRGSNHIVRNSSFASAGTGVYIQYATSVQILNNSFFDISTQVGGDLSSATVSGSQTVTSAPWCPGPSNNVPVADAGADQAVLSTGALTNVSLDGSGSSDADATDVLTYSWAWSGGSATGVTPIVSLGTGTHTITLTVDDQKHLY